VPLTEAGRAAAEALAPAFAGHRFDLVLASPMARAQETARLAGFARCVVMPELREWDYGDFEGLTTAEIRARGPEWADWTVWKGPLPNGETVEQVGHRAEQVLARIAALEGAREGDADGDVLIFGHGHQLRILAAVAVELGPGAGARLALDPARISVVGHEHESRVLRTWNAHP